MTTLNGLMGIRDALVNPTEIGLGLLFYFGLYSPGLIN